MQRKFFNLRNVLLTCIFSCATVQSVKPRSVNLALETSFIFDPQDIKENATFIQNLQGVIDKLKSVLNQNTPVFRQQPKGGELFTKFLTEIGSSLIKFDDADVRTFTNDLIEVVKIQVDNNDAFNEMIEDDFLKSFIKNTVKEWANTDPMKIKVEIAKYVINNETNAIVSFFRVLNKFYDETDEPNFAKLLKKFSKAKKSKKFSNFLTKTLDVAVFDRYKKLNILLKEIWKQELKKFADHVTTLYKDRLNSDKNESANYRRLSLSNVARAQTFSESSRESFETSESIEVYKTKAPNQNNAENEIILNKDIQMDVRTDGQVISVA